MLPRQQVNTVKHNVPKFCQNVFKDMIITDKTFKLSFVNENEIKFEIVLRILKSSFIFNYNFTIKTGPL